MQCVKETTKIVRVTFDKKKTEILRKKPFELSSEDTKRLQTKDPWRFGR